MRPPRAKSQSALIAAMFRQAQDAGDAFLEHQSGERLFGYYAALNQYRQVIGYLQRKAPAELPRVMPPLLYSLGRVIFEACHWDVAAVGHADVGRAHLPELIDYLEETERLFRDGTGVDPAERTRLEALLRLTIANAYVLHAETTDQTNIWVAQLDFSRDQFKEVRSALPRGDGEWTEATIGLAAIHTTFYDRSRAIAELERAEQLLAELTTETPGGQQMPVEAAAPLADVRRHRFELTGDRGQLASAVGLLRPAIAAAAPQQVPGLTVRLGIALAMLGTSGDSLPPLDEAIELLQAEGSREAHGFSMDATEWLARALAARGVLRLDDADLLAAANYLTGLLGSLQSYDATGSAAWVRYQQQLTWLLERRSKLAADPEQLALAKQGYQTVLGLAGAPLDLVMFAATRLGYIHLFDREPQSAAEVFERGLEIQHLLVSAQAQRAQAFDVISHEDPLAIGAAVAYARCDRADRAAVVIERSRARILAEALERDRVDLDRLAAAGHPGARDRYLAANAELDRLIRKQADPEYLSDAQAEIAQAVDEIRDVPGWAGFLRPAELPDVLAAAAEQSLVYLVPCDDTGLAIIVGPDSVRHQWLPDLTGPGLQAEVTALRGAYEGWEGAAPAEAAPAHERYERAFVRVCGWLGSAVMGPLLAELAGADRITLVTCGLLGGLPLHAALLPGPDGAPAPDRYALDQVLISYAANARSLTSASAVRERLTAGSLLSIADPDTPQGKTLPAASAEARAVGLHFPADRRISLSGADATSDAVLRALGQADVLHAACHAISYPASPMESALILSGGVRLTARELSEQRILADGGGLLLAVLSACESAVIGRAAPDEAIGLPAALIEAGAAAVVASLVVVPDGSTALLMARFYDYWLTDGMPTPEALRSAQRWLRDATNGELLARYPALLADASPAEGFRRRLWERARAHRHPTRWAAFVHIGL
jgi:CHAT domain-containing protein